MMATLLLFCGVLHLYNNGALSRHFRNWIFCLIGVASLFSLAVGETSVMHYGHFGGLSISCKRGQLILMKSTRLGYSNDNDCRPKVRSKQPEKD